MEKADDQVYKEAQQIMDDLLISINACVAAHPEIELKDVAYATISGMMEKKANMEDMADQQFAASQTLIAFVAIGLPLSMAINIAEKCELVRGFRTSVKIYEEAGFITIHPKFYTPPVVVKDKCHSIAQCTQDAVDNCDNCGLLVCALHKQGAGCVDCVKA